MPLVRARSSLGQVGISGSDGGTIELVSTAAPIDAGELPPEWREHYAELAATWVRERGTLPPSLEALARWGAEATSVSVDDEVAYLEGRGGDPCSASG